MSTAVTALAPVLARDAPKPISSRYRPETVVNVLQTAHWFHSVCQNAGVSTPRNLMKFLSPTMAANPDWLHHQLKKWRAYLHGLRRPQGVYVAFVNRGIPGTAAAYNHIYWQILRRAALEQRPDQSHLRSLCDQVKNIIFFEGKLLTPTRQRLRKLEQFSNLDTLAYLTYLLHKSLFEKDSKKALEISRWVFHSLLIQAVDLSTNGIDGQLFRLYELCLFSKIAFEQHKVDLDCFDFLGAALELEVLYRSMRFDPAEIREKSISDLLNGKRGMIINALFALPTVLSVELGASIEEVSGDRVRNKLSHNYLWWSVFRNIDFAEFSDLQSEAVVIRQGS